MNTTKGFTLIELLFVVVIVGVILSIGIINGRNTLRKSEGQASLKTIQQSIWQGATTASARGVVTTLNKSGNQLTIVRQNNNEVLRTFELSDGVSTNLEDGQILEFLPPGEISDESYNLLPDPVTVTTPQGTYTLTISIIGEVLVQEN